MRPRWSLVACVAALAVECVSGESPGDYSDLGLAAQWPSPFTCPTLVVDNTTSCPPVAEYGFSLGHGADGPHDSQSDGASRTSRESTPDAAATLSSPTSLEAQPAAQHPETISSAASQQPHHTQPAIEEEKKSPWTRSTICRRVGRDEFCAFAHQSFGSGQGISLITTPARILILGSQPPLDEVLPPLSPEQVIPETASSPYQDVFVPGKGIGLVASEPIRAGRRIMLATPAVMVDDRAFTGLRKEDLAILLAQAVVNLPKTHRARFLNLSGSVDDEGSQLDSIHKIFTTNAFKTTIKTVETNLAGVAVPAGEIDFHSTFTEVSRLNHDCSPNLGYYFDSDTLSHKVYAVRDVFPGEELTISYVDVIQPRSVRQDRLRSTWSFSCTCPRCSAEPHVVAESDDRVGQMLQLRRELDDYSIAATPEKAELLLTLYELEGLAVRIYEAYYRVALEWNGVGESARAMKYARLCLDKGLTLRGPDRPFVDSMRELVANPTTHWSWRFRLKEKGKESNGSS
ncbi:hypothetical protein B0H63DRAFT_472625 [Podospora didyma]|uniref:SET domain-containing protein n=1 Tax=Podospora didyma TaxID=330526 RepID=A0AAE0NPE2_9PEZI|nr:hypothetical protein B0H63DRAFT_472625 [Podospora didyma]